MVRNQASSIVLTPRHWQAFAADLEKESDRGAAIVGSAVLDHLLGELIARHLLDDKRAADELLTSPLSPLGTFYARILAAYCLGLVTSDERADLTIIRKMRNEFAHGPPGLTFADVSISSLMTFRILDGLPAPLRAVFSTEPRRVFVNVVSMLATFLKMRVEAGVQRATPPSAITIQEVPQPGS